MIPDRDYALAKYEVERRLKAAAAERLARAALRPAETAHAEPAGCDERPRGAAGWLRRLSGARN